MDISADVCYGFLFVIGVLMCFLGSKVMKVCLFAIGAAVGATLVFLGIEVLAPQLAIYGINVPSLTQQELLYAACAGGLLLGIVTVMILNVLNWILFAAIFLLATFLFFQSGMVDHLEELVTKLGVGRADLVVCGVALVVAIFMTYKVQKYLLRVVNAVLGGLLAAIGTSHFHDSVDEVDVLALAKSPGSFSWLDNKPLLIIWVSFAVVSLYKESSAAKKKAQ
mmetsp:Transcript_12429/g.16059  ORF Transcript_12429/g.16059 Transcript_12429/m.16059 type:complete len:223 (-) Transcript_12429:409-1077(-)